MTDTLEEAPAWRPVCSACGKEEIDALHVPITCMACDAPWDGSELLPDGTVSVALVISVG